MSNFEVIKGYLSETEWRHQGHVDPNAISSGYEAKFVVPASHINNFLYTKYLFHKMMQGAVYDVIVGSSEEASAGVVATHSISTFSSALFEGCKVLFNPNAGSLSSDVEISQNNVTLSMYSRDVVIGNSSYSFNLTGTGIYFDLNVSDVSNFSAGDNCGLVNGEYYASALKLDKIGVGTDSPSYPIHISQESPTIFVEARSQNADYARIQLTTKNSVGVNNYGEIYQSGSAGLKIGTYGGAGDLPISFYTNNVKRMTLTDDGNLGLGIADTEYVAEFYRSNENTVLQIHNDSITSNNYLNFDARSGRGSIVQWKNDGGIAGLFCMYPAGDTRLFCISNSSNKDSADNVHLMLERDGNLGLGVYNPNYKLHVNGTSFFEDDVSTVRDLSAGNGDFYYDADSLRLSIGGNGDLYNRDAQVYISDGINNRVSLALEASNGKGPEVSLGLNKTEKMRFGLSGSNEFFFQTILSDNSVSTVFEIQQQADETPYFNLQTPLKLPAFDSDTISSKLNYDGMLAYDSSGETLVYKTASGLKDIDPYDLLDTKIKPIAPEFLERFKPTDNYELHADSKGWVLGHGYKVTSQTYSIALTAGIDYDFILTDAQYADLYAACGSFLGNVLETGVTSTDIHLMPVCFTLPNLQGQFIRFYDETSGVDPDFESRGVLSEQLDDYKSHNHPASSSSKIGQSGWSAETHEGSLRTTAGVQWKDSYNSVTVNNSGGTETRPKNISLVGLIKIVK